MNIGARIKELRIEQKITQDRLSEYLGISPQAVSKWENGTSMPDITALPMLAEIFNVTADYLLGIEYDVRDSKTEEYRRKYRELQIKGDNKGRCELMRKALAEYPRNYEFMNNLARSLPHVTGNPEDYQEIIELCKRIIAGCRDDSIRFSAIQTICRAYSYIGEDEKAAEYARMLPPRKYAREDTLAWIAKGENKAMIIQSNTLDLLMELGGYMISRTGHHMGMGNFELSFDDELTVYNTVLSLLKLPFNDENYYLINGKLAHVYRYMARLYALNADSENAMNCLKLAEHHADDFETNKDKGLKYTSIFFDKLQFEFTGTRHGDNNEYERLLRNIRQWHCFDFMRDSEEFKAFEKELEEKTNAAR